MMTINVNNFSSTLTLPTIYIYAASDFVGTVPGESVGAAAGSPPFTLQLQSSAQPIAVEVNDTNDIVDEITSTGSQTFTNSVTIGGVLYPAGTSFSSAYDLFQNANMTGMKLTSLHFGGNGYQQGAVDAFISSEPLVPGTTYTFNAERTSHQQPDNTYDSYVACFCKGTLIQSAQGELPVEQLEVGQLVMTKDFGLQKIKWIGNRTISSALLEQNERLRPIRIRRNSLGDRKPTRDLLVSPQHRILVRSKIAQRMFSSDEVLVAAKHLTAINGIETVEDFREVEYFHILFDTHQLILSNGVESESLFTGPEAIKSVSKAAREEIYLLFPELENRDHRPVPARELIKGREGRQLALRHKRNAMELVC